MGTARILPTAALKTIPSFISIPRLESSLAGVIEFLLAVAHWNKAVRGTGAVARQARPRHRRHLPATSVCRARRLASQARPFQAVRQLQSCEGPGRLPARETNRPQ